MNRLVKIVVRWLVNIGFFFGINDVIFGFIFYVFKDVCVEKVYDECDVFIDFVKKGKLENVFGCD